MTKEEFKVYYIDQNYMKLKDRFLFYITFEPGGDNFYSYANKQAEKAWEEAEEFLSKLRRKR